MAPPDAAAPAAPGHRLALPLLLMLCAATYLPTLQGGFVWDDHQLVGDRAELLAHGSLRDFFSTSLFGAAWGETLSVYYRPMVLLSLALDQRLWEGDPFGFHLQNLGWHLLAVGVCHALLRRLASPAGALVGTALFAMHPLQSEAVGWISGRAEPMALVGMTLAVLLAWPARPGAARSLGAGLSLLLALLTKETALTTLALVPMLDVARWGRPRGGRRATRPCSPRWACGPRCARRPGWAPRPSRPPSAPPSWHRPCATTRRCCGGHGRSPARSPW